MASRFPAALTELLFFPFEGPDWEQQWLILTLVLSLLTVVFLPLAWVIEMGCAYQVARRALVMGEPPALPGRLDWKAILWDGLRWYVVSMVFSLPGFLALLAALLVMFARYGLPSEGAWPGLERGWPVLVIGLLVSLALSALGGWLSNLAALNLIRHDRLAAAFRVGEWWRVLAADPGGFFRALLRVLVVSILLSLAQLVLSIPASVLIILPVLVGAFFSLYQRLISAAVYAGVYREALERAR